MTLTTLVISAIGLAACITMGQKRCW